MYRMRTRYRRKKVNFTGLVNDSADMHPLELVDDNKQNMDLEDESTIPRISGQDMNRSFLMFGIVCLLVYSCFLEQLWYYTTCVSENLAIYSQIAYAVASNLGHLGGIFANDLLPVHLRVYTSCIVVAFVSLCFPILAQVEFSHKLPIALILSSVLGASNAACISTAAGLASVTSDNALQYLYMGQSVSGLIPWPLMLLTKLFLRAIGVSSTGLVPPVESISSIIVMVSCGCATIAFCVYFRVSLWSRMEPYWKSYQITPSASVRDTLKLTMALMLGIWYTMVVSFTVYPREMIKWRPDVVVHPATYTSMMVFVVICSDVVGMWCAQFGATLSDKLILILVVLRTGFIPIFWAAPGDSWIIHLLISSSMALSSGYLFAACMARVESKVVGISGSRTAGYIITFAVVNGIAAGSGVGWLIELLE
jgi:hypothetical protein